MIGENVQMIFVEETLKRATGGSDCEKMEISNSDRGDIPTDVRRRCKIHSMSMQCPARVERKGNTVHQSYFDDTEVDAR